MTTSPKHLPLTESERAVELAAYNRDSEVIAGVEQLRFFPLAVRGGRDSRLIAASGRELIDFSASWTASGTGHAHPDVVDAVSDAIADQAGASVLSSATSASTQLAEQLLDLVPTRGDDRRVYLGLAGTDANDVAVRAVRHATGRHRILSFIGSYHGGLGLSQQVSGIGIEVGTDAPEATLLPYPTTETELADVLTRVAAELARGDVAGVLVEAVQCDGGVLVPPNGFISGLRGACDEHGTLLVLDEVKAGLGRTGVRFAYEQDNVLPEVVTLGKALGGGLPVSAVVADVSLLGEPVASALLTAAGNPVSCAAASAAIQVLTNETTLANVAARGAEFREFVADYRASDRIGSSHLAECRGRGLLHGLELVDAEGNADDTLAAMAIYRAWELGCVLYVVRGNVLECTPPLTISAADLRLGTERILQAIDDAVAGLVPTEALEAFSGW